MITVPRATRASASATPVAVLSALALALSVVAGPSAAQQPADIGATAAIVNQVTGSSGNRTLKLGDRVFANEVIATGAQSRSQLLFRDETALTVGPESEVRLDAFIYNPNRSGSTAVVSATKGVLRFATGNMPSNAYQIRTPVGTVGVRGTIFEMIVGATSLTLVLLEGAVDFTTVSGVVYRLTAAGQVLNIRSDGTANVTSQLTSEQLLILSGVRETALASDPRNPNPGLDRDLRQSVKGGKSKGDGGGGGPNSP